MAVQVPKNSSSSSFSATTCCDFTGWDGKGVRGGEEREKRRERRQQLIYTCTGTNSAFNDAAPPTLEMVVSLLISSRGRREGW